MNLVKEKNACCGCAACHSLCPKRAIEMTADGEGFMYPAIDPTLCVGCGLCEKVCDLRSTEPTRTSYPRIYGVKHKDDMVRMNSTSGGAFTAFGERTIKDGGCVYGAAFDGDFDVVHIKADRIADLDKLKGTKYVQSDISDVYREVHNDLSEGRAVMFTGTPCQCDGLKKYLTLKNCDTSDLLLCDIICHGVPSPRVWRDYLKKITARKRLAKYSFRDKRYGWHGANVTAVFEDGTSSSNTVLLRSFSKLYFRNYISRPSCAECRYTSFDRCTDLTIGDFWGIEKANPSFDDRMGVSLVLVNTEKGERFFDRVKGEFEIFECDQNDCEQEQLKHPQAPAPKRVEFWRDYDSKGFDYIIKRYGGCDFYGVIRRGIYNLLKRFFK